MAVRAILPTLCCSTTESTQILITIVKLVTARNTGCLAGDGDLYSEPPPSGRSGRAVDAKLGPRDKDYLGFVGLHKLCAPATKVALVDRPLYLYARRDERKWIRRELSNGEGTTHGHLPCVRRNENAVQTHEMLPKVLYHLTNTRLLTLSALGYPPSDGSSAGQHHN